MPTGKALFSIVYSMCLSFEAHICAIAMQERGLVHIIIVFLASEVHLLRDFSFAAQSVRTRIVRIASPLRLRFWVSRHGLFGESCFCFEWFVLVVREPAPFCCYLGEVTRCPRRAAT